MLLNDKQIAAYGMEMISPFKAAQVREGGVISYGLSSYGYDIRVADEFRIFTPTYAGTVIDPKAFNNSAFVEIIDDTCVIPPNSFMLARSFEYMRVPEDVMCLVVGKSTYARCGIIINVTPLEPGWCGHITIEISNTAPLPAKIYAGEGIAQVLFFKGEKPDVTYADRAGKYQGQTGVTLPKV